MSLKVFHNTRCKKSRAGLEYLKEKTNDYEIVEYLKEGLSKKDLEEILLKTNLRPEDLVRTQEAYFKKELKGKNFNRDEWVTIISENPKLLQRPVVVGKHKAVIGDPAENIDAMFK